MKISGYLNLLITPVFLITFSSYSQVDPDKYQTVQEIFDQGGEEYDAEEYDKAYLTYLRVNFNDTSYFDARSRAVQSASAQKKYDTVITLCKEVLAVKKNNSLREWFTNSQAHGLLQQDKNEEALAFLTESLKEFPRSYLLLYNRSVAYYELEKYDESVIDLQMSIRFNPKYYASHVKLGVICAQAGDLTKAALSLNMGLFLIASEKRAINLLSSLESLYSGDLGDKKIKVNYREEEDFDEIDLMINNKLAENSKYKVKVKLNYKFIKHNHLLFETMQFDPESNGFWNQTYVNYYKQIFEKGEFANYSYFLSYSIDKAKTQAIISKNSSKISNFIKWAGNRLTITMNERTIWDGDKYTSNNLNHVGSYGFNEDVVKKGDKMVGTYYSYTSTGLIKAKGFMNDEGKVDGILQNFDDEGRLTNESTFKNGELLGKYTSFYLNGSRKKEYLIKDKQLDSDVLTFYSCNQLYSKVPINADGEKDGPTEYYYKNGQISNKMTYVKDKLDGVYLKYYEDGQLKSKSNYVMGEIEGKYVSYHENGKINIEGNYEKSVSVGHWKYFHDNGKKKEEGELKSGYRIGVWETFNKYGNLEEETNYGETGKKTGVYKKFSLDGNLEFELTYKGEEIILYKTYNSKGEIVSQKEKKKKELEFVDYYENGIKRREGNYYKGKQVGIWKSYNQYGILTSENAYNKEGQLDGVSKWYFDNGEIETIKKYKEDVVDGYFVDYYRNGNIFKHGWLIDGETVGEWEYFYRNGQKSSSRYFLEGELHGDIVRYDEKGRKHEITTYFYGNFESVTMYDSLENQIGYYPLINGAAKSNYKDMNGKTIIVKEYKGTDSNGEQISYFANGQIKSKGSAIYGNYTGSWQWFNRKGTLLTEGSYYLGEKNGEWKWYHDNGKISLIKNYVNGIVEGVVNRYYPNGKKETVKNYRNNERHGESTYYDETGAVQYIRYYDDGLMLGYSYLGKDGKPVPIISFDNQNGKIEAYFSNGKKSYVGEYKNGFSQGTTIYYHSNGEKADVRLYEKNQYHGNLVEYYNDGTVKMENEYVNGNLHGISKEYYKNGKTKSIEHYILGDKYGWSEYYSEDGKLSEKVFYYNDRQLN